jgi:flagellar basal-body rod modification protein FlgD
VTDPLTQALTSATTGSTSSTSRAPSTTLGKDDFLKLLVGQMQHQDPLAPSDDQQWMTQMAQFTEVEQVTNMAASTKQIVDSLNRSGMLSLIGRTVTYTGADGSAVTGLVEQVDMDKDGGATLTVSGKGGIDARSVTQVR